MQEKLKTTLESNFYCYDNRTLNVIDADNKNNIVKIIKGLEKREKLVYRGFSEKYVNDNFWDWFFTVGEKGEHYRNEIKISSRHSKDTKYFSNHVLQSEENYRKILDDIQNRIAFNFYEMVPDLSNLSKRIESYRCSNDIDYIDMYYFLLGWLHNIGGKTGYKKDSPLISTSTSIDEAFGFADEDNANDVKYVILAYLGDGENVDYYCTTKLNQILKKMKVNWYDDIHAEVMFKDAIFPHSIIGIIKKENNEYNLIINPSILNLLKLKLSFEDNLRFLLKIGIQVSQEKFDEGAEILGYKKYVEQLGDKRSVNVKEEKYDIRKIKETKL